MAWFGSAPGKVHDQASLLHTLIHVSVFHAFINSTAAEYNRLDGVLHFTYFSVCLLVLSALQYSCVHCRILNCP